MQNKRYRFSPILPSFLLLSLLLSPLLPPAHAAYTHAALQKMMDEANQDAAGKQYEKAIPLYETLIRELPQEKQLKENLMVLYVNQALILQEKKQYDIADTLLEKALKLDPKNTHAKQARAIGAYNQALDLHDTMHASLGGDSIQNADSKQYRKIQALLEKAVTLNPAEKAFKKSLASVYLSEAQADAYQTKYQEAEPLLKKAQALTPEDLNIRHTLADLYLSLTLNDPKNSQDWLKKAYLTDPSPEFKTKASQALGHNQPDINPGRGSLVNTSGANQQASDFSAGNLPADAEASGAQESARRPIHMPLGTGQLSVVDMLKDIEHELNLPTNTQSTLKQRLESAEMQVYGKKQAGPVNTRAKQLYTAVFGDKTQAAGLQLSAAPLLAANTPAEGSINPDEDTYIKRVYDITGGKNIRWARFPVRVYIEGPPKNTKKLKGEEAQKWALYQPAFHQAVLAGFKQWQEASHGFVSYVEVKNPLAADINVVWNLNYTDRFSMDALAQEKIYSKLAAPRPSHVGQMISTAGYFMPGYIGLAPQAVGAAFQYHQLHQIQVLTDESKIKLGLKPTQGLAPEDAITLVENMAAHEFGHAIGLKGHSDLPQDLMSADQALQHQRPVPPTVRDLQTLQLLYSQPATIVLNVH